MFKSSRKRGVSVIFAMLIPILIGGAIGWFLNEKIKDDVTTLPIDLSNRFSDDITLKNGDSYELKRIKEFLDLWADRDIYPHGISNTVHKEGSNSVRMVFIDDIGVVPGIFNGIEFSQDCPSKSMIPSYPCGSTAIVYKPKSMDDIFVGDIVLSNVTVATVNGVEQFQYFEHRVIEKRNDGVCVQGDNLDYVGYTKSCGIGFDKILYKVIGIIY